MIKNVIQKTTYNSLVFRLIRKEFWWIFFIGILSLISLNTSGQSRDKSSLNRKADTLILGGDSVPNKRGKKTILIREITVTASKFPKSLSESGKVVEIISREQLSESQGKTVADILGDIPGIQIEGLHSNPGFAPKTLFIQGASGDNSLILIDGMPVSDPSSLGSNFDIRLVNPDQFERIEVLKGGQSTLYGSDAVAGVINLISRKPTEKGLRLSGSFTGGSYGTFKENFRISHQIDSGLGYLAGYTHFKTNGLQEAQDNGSDSAHTGHFHKDGMVEDNFYYSANWNLGKFRISPNLDYSSLSGRFSNGAYFDGINPYYSKNLVSGIQGRYSIQNGTTLYLNEGFTYTKRYYGGDYPSGYVGRFNQAEAYLDQSFGKYFQLLSGLNYQIQQVLDSSSASLKKNPSISILSPYISLFMNSYKGFNLSLGGRWNHHSSYGNNFTYNINPSLYWKSYHLKIFADYASSFRAPKLPELYGAYGANPGLKPETSQSLEAGFGGNYTLDGMNESDFNFRVLGFYRNIQNAIVYLYPKGYLNQDQQKDMGYELVMGLKLNSKLRFQASMSVLTGKVKTKSLNTGMDTLYNNLIRRPKYTLHLGIHYQVLKALNLSIDYSSYSDRFDEDFNTGNYITLPNYALLNAHGVYSMDHKEKLKVFMQFGNILNSSYTEIIGFNTMKFNYQIGFTLAL